MRVSAFSLVFSVVLVCASVRAQTLPAPGALIDVYDGFKVSTLDPLWETSRFTSGAVAMQSAVVRAGSGAVRITLQSHDTFEAGQNGNADSERVGSTVSRPDGVGECRASDLRIAAPEQPDGGLGHQAHVFQVTNSSRRSCTLKGFPLLRFRNRHNQAVQVRVCENCMDYLVHPVQPVRMIPLRPGESSHFLIGFMLGPIPELSCHDVSRVEVLLGKSVLRFDLFGGNQSFSMCDVTGTAWRPGALRDDEAD